MTFSLEIFGDNEPAFFKNAGERLISMLVDPKTMATGGMRERIEVHGPDRESLLVAWLNQIRFLLQTQDMVLSEFEIDTYLSPTPEHPEQDEFSLIAYGNGELLDPGRHKVLMHINEISTQELSLVRGAGTWSAELHFNI